MSGVKRYYNQIYDEHTRNVLCFLPKYSILYNTKKKITLFNQPFYICIFIDYIDSKLYRYLHKQYYYAIRYIDSITILSICV